MDVRYYSSLDQVLSFEIAQDVDSIGDVLTFLIRGTPISAGSNFDGYVSVFSSDHIDEKLRPDWSLTHTNISSLNISTQSTSFDSDGTYLFNIDAYDSIGQIVLGDFQNAADIEWSTTSGTIASAGQTTASMSPTSSGTQVITGCYGVICTEYTLEIEPGTPVELFASYSQTQNVDYLEISADETAQVFAYATDQYGNVVVSEVISFSSSNGTVDSSGLFSPYSVGIHTITAEWAGASSSLQENLQVNVLPGSPTTVVLSGCDDVLQAGTSCDLLGSAYDQFNNAVWFDDVGSYTFSSPNGEFSQVETPTPHSSPPASDVLIGAYVGDLVGQWQLNFTSEFNIVASTHVDVTHGAISGFELTSSNTSITADEILYLNTTRIDVRGNRLAVTLPLDNWSSLADGELSPGSTAIWHPKLQGTKTITANYEGYSDTISVFVLRGVINQLNIFVDDGLANNQMFSITADDDITASILALDANGNQWIVDGNWSFSHPDFNDNSVLSSTYSQDVTFSPTMASTTPYTIYVEHTELTTLISATFSVSVSVGNIEIFAVDSVDSNGLSYNELESYEITSDDFIQFSFTTYDGDGNEVSNNQPTWLLENVATGEITDISEAMFQNAYVWQATLVGDWQILTYLINQKGFNLSAEFDVSVSHGIPVQLTLQQTVTTQNAGDFVDLLVTGIDSDANEFPQPVVWLENDGPSYNINETSDDGYYRFNGRSAGNYTITAEYLSISESVYVEVFSLGIVKNIKSNISNTEVEQLETIRIELEAYDQYWNKIPVPSSARIETTDSGDVEYLGNGVWEQSTLDTGQHFATIEIGSDVSETFTYNVEGNLAGFFAAGGPLYYVGAGLIGLIVVALLIFVVRLLRGDDDYYDDDEDDDYYQDTTDVPVAKDFSQPRISQAPTVATPPTQPPAPEPEPVVQETAESETEQITETEAEDTSWIADYRVEDDGTEWGQTADGVWYYREVNTVDWVEWTD